MFNKQELIDFCNNARENYLGHISIDCVVFGFHEGQLKVLVLKMKNEDSWYEPMGGKLSGAIVQSDMHKPSADGVKVYFNGNPDLNTVLSKVEAAGGKITISKGKISDDIGYMAFFMDTEGNAVALHSQG